MCTALLPQDVNPIEGKGKVPRFRDNGGKVVSLTHRPLLLPENADGTHFC